MPSMRKRNVEEASGSSERGQEDEGPARKIAKVDVEDSEAAPNEHRPEEVFTSHSSHPHHSCSTCTVFVLCVFVMESSLTDCRKPESSYLDLSYWAFTHKVPAPSDSFTETASFPPQYSAPLTEENLLALDETMVAKTPKKDTSVGSGTDSSVNVSRAFQILNFNNIFVDNEDAAERGKDVIQEAKKIFKAARHSQITDDQAEMIRKTASELSMDDELTFMVGVWKLVIGTERTVELKDKQDQKEYVERAWVKDHLKCNWSSHYAANIAPPLRFADNGMEALANLLPKLKNAFPDLTYGYDHGTFTPEQMAINESINGELCRRNWHAFLIGEAKSVDQPFEIGVAQAARAAATAIHLRRKLQQEAKPSVIAGPNIPIPSSVDSQHNAKPSVIAGPNIPISSSVDSQHDAASSTSNLQHSTNPAILTSSGPNPAQTQHRADKSSFIYTFVISPELARLFVAWAEEEWKGGNQEPGINYHMKRLRGYYFGEGADHWAALHHDLDNILDWGVGPREMDVLNLLNDIASKAKDGKKRART